jgi:hypothetical protein
VTVQSPRSLRPAIQLVPELVGALVTSFPLALLALAPPPRTFLPRLRVRPAGRRFRPPWVGLTLREGFALRTPCPDAGGRAGPSASRQPSQLACRGRPRRRTPYCEAARATSAASPESARYMARAPRAGRATGAAGSIARSTHLEPHGILSPCGSRKRKAGLPAVRRHEAGSAFLQCP